MFLGIFDIQNQVKILVLHTLHTPSSEQSTTPVLEYNPPTNPAYQHQFYVPPNKHKRSKTYIYIYMCIYSEYIQKKNTYICMPSQQPRNYSSRNRLKRIYTQIHIYKGKYTCTSCPIDTLELKTTELNGSYFIYFLMCACHYFIPRLQVLSFWFWIPKTFA